MSIHDFKGGGAGLSGLMLKSKSLKKLDFLTKFLKEFPKIQHIDLRNNDINKGEMEKFMRTLEQNRHIQKIDIGGNKVGGQIKSRMQ